MIKASELRLGSIISDKDGNWIELTEDRLQVLFAARDFENYFGISINEASLNKIGFEWDIPWQGFTDGRYVVEICHDETITFSYGKRRREDYQLLRYIKYIHQLQNLLFAVSQMELKVIL